MCCMQPGTESMHWDWSVYLEHAVTTVDAAQQVKNYIYMYMHVFVYYISYQAKQLSDTGVVQSLTGDIICM